MAKRRKKSSRTRKAPKGSSWRKHFGAVARACFREGPTSGKEFGRCMKSNL